MVGEKAENGKYNLTGGKKGWESFEGGGENKTIPLSPSCFLGSVQVGEIFCKVSGGVHF